MAPAGFNDFINILAQTDFFTSIIPFALSFVVSYLALGKAPLFKESDRSNLVVSVAFGFIVANFAIANPGYVAFYQNFLAGVTLTVLVTIGFLVALAYVGLDVPGEFDRDQWGFIKSASVLVVGIIAAAVVLSGLDVLGAPALGLPDADFGPVTEILFDSGGIYVLVIAGLAYLLLKEDGGGGGGDGDGDDDDDGGGG
jgi:hypothetical protein|nr:MAG: hypothetical protein J07AB56_02680 [Candidatus Nanosalinarum sp. J07AB56]